MKSFADDLFNSYVIIDVKTDDDDVDDANRKMENAKLIKKTENCRKTLRGKTLSHLSET